MSDRATLLRTLAAIDAGLDGVEPPRAVRLADALGFEPGFDETALTGHEPEANQPMGGSSSPLPSPTPDGNEGILRSPRKPPCYWMVTACTPHIDAREVDDRPLPEPDPELMIGGPPQHRPTPPPLRTPGQWQNLWDRLIIGEGRGRQPDIRASVRLMSQARPINTLPLRPRHHFNGPIVLLEDRSDRLSPAHPDMDLAWWGLHRLVGADGLSRRVLRRGPDRAWFDPTDPERPTDEQGLPRGAEVLVISDFGKTVAGERGKALQSQWLALMQRIRARGHRVHALALATPPALPNRVALDPRQGVTAERPMAHLLGVLSQTWRMDRQQLRYLRHALPGATLADELRLLAHPDVQRRQGYLDLSEQGKAHWEAVFKGLPAADRAALERAFEQWTVNRNPRQREMDAMQGAQSDQIDPRRLPRLLAILERCAQVGALALTPFERAEFIAAVPLLTQLASKLDAASPWQPVMREARRAAAALDQPLPGGLVPGELDNAYPSPRWLRHEQNRLVVADRSHRALLSLTRPPFAPALNSVVQEALPTQPDGVDLIDGEWQYRIEPQPKPPWADRCWQEADGRWIAEHPAGARFAYQPASPTTPTGRWQCLHHDWPWATDLGVDDHGLWADLSLNGVVQRMRWIPAGRFEMGSPEDEAGRQSDETLHEVILSEGFWLGETTVTRALWAAGESPGRRFVRSLKRGGEKEPHLPKAKVSWDDVQEWLQEVDGQAQGLNLRLPTEAWWEYACRADSRSAYWWGDEMDETKCNHGSEVAEERDLPPNPWGLRSMHGNVWEWCADRYGDYPAEPVQDPEGPSQGQERVLRGGSWINVASYLRAAQRDAYTPDYRYGHIGFRLAGGLDPQASRQGGHGQSADRVERSGTGVSAQAVAGVGGGRTKP